MGRRTTLWPLLSMLALAVALAAPAPARARSVVVHSQPSDGAVLTSAPRELQLWFDSAAIIEPGAVTLRDAAGRPLAIDAAHSDIYKPDDAGLGKLFDPTFLFLCSLGLNSYPTTLVVHLPELAPGTYRLDWRALAVKDRQTTTGSLVFAVDPSAPPTADAADAQTRSITSTADDLLVTMAVRPNRPGQNFISLQATALRRPIRAPVAQMTLRLTPPGGAPRDLPLAQAPDGRFLVSGDLIDRPGSWGAEIRIDRGPAPATVASLAWEVPASSPGPPPPPTIAAAVGVAALCGGLLILRRRARRRA